MTTAVLKIIVFVTVTSVSICSEFGSRLKNEEKKPIKDKRQLQNPGYHQHYDQKYEYYHPYNYDYHYELPRTGYEYHHGYVQQHNQPRQNFGYHHVFGFPPHLYGLLSELPNYHASNDGYHHRQNLYRTPYMQNHYRIMNNPYHQDYHQGYQHFHHYPSRGKGKYYYNTYSKPLVNYGEYGNYPKYPNYSDSSKWKGYGGYSSPYNGIGYDYGYDNEYGDNYRGNNYHGNRQYRAPRGQYFYKSQIGNTYYPNFSSSVSG